MLAKRIIPCLDVTEGRVVKGTKFIDLKDAGDPVELAAYYDKEGADELVFLDITASSDKRYIMLEVVKKVAEKVFIPFTVGGGIDDIETMREILAGGADKVSINTAAVRDPALIEKGAGKFGSQCVVLAIDAKKVGEKKWEIYTHGGRTPDRDRCGGVGEKRGKTGGGGDPLNQHGSRWDQRRVRARPDTGDRRRRKYPGHCVWRSGPGRTYL